MTETMYQKAIESVRTYGFVDPLTVQPISPEEGYLIIDGEHRFKAGVSLGMVAFPCVVIYGLTDDQAKKLTIVLNELHGQADPGKLGDLLNDIMSLTSLDQLRIALPYDDKTLGSLLGTLPPLPPLPSAPPVAPPTGGTKEPWVERLYKMPKSVALVIDEAIEKAKDGEEVESWQALERVAADYLGS